MYSRGPQTLGYRLVPVHGLLGTRLQSRRWVVGEQKKLHLYLQRLPIAHITTLSQCNNNRNKVHNKCNAVESSQNHPPNIVCGKIVFYKTHPLCLKCWGPLMHNIYDLNNISHPTLIYHRFCYALNSWQKDTLLVKNNNVYKIPMSY